MTTRRGWPRQTNYKQAAAALDVSAAQARAHLRGSLAGDHRLHAAQVLAAHQSGYNSRYNIGRPRSGRNGSLVAARVRMPNVFWLGGGCGSGKTTIARVVTRRLDLRLYPVDGYTYAHAERSKRGGFLLNQAVAELTPEQRWARTPAELAGWFAAGAAERLEMILADLRDLGPGPTVVAEGPQLFPDLIAPLMQTPEYGLWLLPTPRVRPAGSCRAGERAALPVQRHSAGAIVTCCSPR